MSSSPLSKIQDSISKLGSETTDTNQAAQKVVDAVVGSGAVEGVVEKLPEAVQKIGRVQIPSVFGQSILKDSKSPSTPTQESSLAASGKVEFNCRIGPD